MEVVIAVLALAFALSSVMVAVLLLQNVRKLQSQISTLEKKIHRVSEDVEQQEAALRTIRGSLASMANPLGMGAAPVLRTLLGAKRQGVGPTLVMLGLNLVQTMVQRKRGANLPAKIQ